MDLLFFITVSIFNSSLQSQFLCDRGEVSGQLDGQNLKTRTLTLHWMAVMRHQSVFKSQRRSASLYAMRSQIICVCDDQERSGKAVFDDKDTITPMCAFLNNRFTQVCFYIKRLSLADLQSITVNSIIRCFNIASLS